MEGWGLGGEIALRTSSLPLLSFRGTLFALLASFFLLELSTLFFLHLGIP